MAYVDNPIVEGKDFESVMGDVNGNFEDMKYITEVVFGTYTGNGEEKRTIELGFTPIALEIYPADGMQNYHSDGGDGKNFLRGGFTINGFSATHSYAGNTDKFIEIVENGFTVSYVGLTYGSGGVYSETNKSGVKYYFKAYKSTCNTPVILEIT